QDDLQRVEQRRLSGAVQSAEEDNRPLCVWRRERESLPPEVHAEVVKDDLVEYHYLLLRPVSARAVLLCRPVQQGELPVFPFSRGRQLLVALAHALSRVFLVCVEPSFERLLERLEHAGPTLHSVKAGS